MCAIVHSVSELDFSYYNVHMSTVHSKVCRIYYVIFKDVRCMLVCYLYRTHLVYKHQVVPSSV
jgi:hypothetical protein